jgi:hypothetical protein
MLWLRVLSNLTAILLLSLPLAGQTFGPPTAFPAQIYVSGIKTADFNHDGILDIVIDESEPNQVSIFLGAGNVPPSISWTVNSP